jgi:ATP-dependent DNA helicase
LLRRLKEDVEPDLPRKKEYVLYAPLTQQQKDLSDAVARGGIRQYLINMKGGSREPSTRSVSVATSPEPEDDDEPRLSRRLKKKPRLSYKIEMNDDKFLDDLENGRIQPDLNTDDTAEEIGQNWAMKSASKCLYGISRAFRKS